MIDRSAVAASVGGRVSNPVGALLKARTAATHARVEAQLGLLDDDLTEARLRDVLARFAGFWPVVEQAVEEWAATEPAAAAALSWPRRRRTRTLHADLLALGLPATALAGLPRAQPVFTGRAGRAEVLGWLYVAEGSTLGGAIIDRALRRSGTIAATVSTFTPYAEGPGPMWRAYLDELARWSAEDPTRAEAVARSAQHCFAALAAWLEPLRAEEAA